ncbi:hypothetical protein [Streptomyces sp. NPDC096153]|uniref:hypothetical protein n=1 Tax=Streptomyces sp. NPDC096153 TaxID=3155548 RepID=UPI00331A214C
MLILTTFGADEYVDEAVQAGVSGFLLTDTPPEELLRAPRQVAEGKAARDPAVTGRGLDRLAGQVGAPHGGGTAGTGRAHGT